jgi:two-component system sensor kinase FixL
VTETGPLLAAIAALSNDAIVAKDLDGTVTFWTEGAERLFGYTAAEMVGTPIMRVIPPDRAEEEAGMLARLRRGEKVIPFETERLTKDERTIDVEVTISPIRDEQGQIIGALKVARDLTSAHRTNRELERRQALLETILDTVPDGLIVIDQAGIIQTFSRAAERVFGYEAAELIGCNVSVLMPPSDARQHDSYMSRYLKSGERRIIGIGRVVVGLRKNGTAFPMELQIGEVKIDGAHLFAGYVRDLTARQERERRISELQEELIHVSRVTELGQMVTALAHEVNQPLTAIANYAGGIRRLLPPDGPAALAIATERVIEQSGRARAIVQSVLGLIRKEPRPRGLENLSTMIQETAALALVGSGGRIGLELAVAPEAERVFVDRVQIQQVLLNLMRNAAEAMAGAPGMVLRVCASPRGDQIEIAVCDTGPGLPETVRARLFRPFVTTKTEGLGVGLSICRAIVQAHGGDLTAEDGQVGGTCFRFTVPAREGIAG